MAEVHKITELTRRDIINLLDKSPSGLCGQIEIEAFYQRVWPHDDPNQPTKSERRNFILFTEGLPMTTAEYVIFDTLRFDYASDKDFIHLLEHCVHPLLRRPQKENNRLVTAINKCLVRDGYELVRTSELSGRPIYSCVPRTPTEAHKYEVAFSFAGPDRDFVRECADFISKHGVNVFFDEYNEVDLWGKNLYTHLSGVYSKEARYCVMFVSQHYIKSNWTTVERTAAQERAFEENREYILPFRIDDTPVPGLLKTIAYQSKKTPVELGKIILAKVGYIDPIVKTTTLPLCLAPIPAPLEEMLANPSIKSKDSNDLVRLFNRVDMIVTAFERSASTNDASQAKDNLYQCIKYLTTDHLNRVLRAYCNNPSINSLPEMENLLLDLWKNTVVHPFALASAWGAVFHRLNEIVPSSTVADELRNAIWIAYDSLSYG